MGILGYSAERLRRGAPEKIGRSVGVGLSGPQHFCGGLDLV
jgi:hypothetical protein